MSYSVSYTHCLRQHVSLGFVFLYLIIYSVKKRVGGFFFFPKNSEVFVRCTEVLENNHSYFSMY